MGLIIVVDLVVVSWLIFVAYTKGFENALPVAAFLLLLFPSETRIQLPGLFDLTTQRAIVLVLYGLFLTRDRDEDTEGLREPPLLRYLLVCLVGWMLISSAESVVPAISFKSTLSQYFDFCAVFFIYARSIRDREMLHRSLVGLGAGMAVCCVFGLAEVYAGWKVTSLFPAVAGRFAGLEGVDTRGVRMQSTFDHSILFGAALSMAIPLVLYLLTIASRLRSKVFLWSALAAMLLCIYKTGSRGPWIALVIALSCLTLIGNGQLRKLVLMIVATSILIVAGRPGIRGTLENLYWATQDQDSPQGESYQWRYVLYRIANQELSRDLGRSLWGYGPESFYYLGLTTEFSIEGEIHTVKVESCDSAVVELLMDTGYVGFALVAGFIGTVAVLGCREHFRSLNRYESAFPALCASLLAFCFMMTNVELFGWGQQSYMIWIILAMILRSSKESDEVEVETDRSSPSGDAIGWQT